MDVLVLGGRGFIGRYVTAALRERGDRVIVASRRRGAGVVTVRLERLLEAAAWHPLVRGFDVVVNCVGILRERIGERYEAIHHLAPAALADACDEAAVRLVHVSALGLEGACHAFMTSKKRGEDAILAAMDDCVIVRPSLLDGHGGFGALWLRAMARLPIHVVPTQAVGRIAALDVEDLGLAIAALCHARRGSLERVVEFGGPRALSFADYLRSLRRSARPARTLHAPAVLARVAARVCDALHFSPYSAGHLELLTRDNVPAVNALPGLLGRAPRAVGASRSMIDPRAALTPSPPQPSP